MVLLFKQFFSFHYLILLVLYYYSKLSLNDVCLILRFFLCISASAADVAAVNPKGINTFS